MFKIITTVGTSLITNSIDKDIGDNLKGYESISMDDIDKLERLTAAEINFSDSNIQRMKNIINEHWMKGLIKKNYNGQVYWQEDDGYNEDCCAEIKTIMEFYREKGNIKNLKLEVYLIISDTGTAAFAAELIKDNMSKFNKNIIVKDIVTAKGLQTNDFKNFKSQGIESLFEKLSKMLGIKKGGKSKPIDSDKVVINISGGYKAIVPYMTILAQVYGIESIYIYEDSKSLITIPVLPIQVDWGFAEEYYPYLSNPSIDRDGEAKKTLRDFGLLDKNNGWTALGVFFKEIIEKELHVAKSVMGYFFEYKLYEYFVENPYGKYGRVKHSEYLFEDEKNPKKSVEVDLILNTGDLRDKSYIAIEVKSYNQLRTNYNYVKWQIEKRLNTMKYQYILGYAEEYHLYIYTPNKRLYRELDGTTLDNLKALKRVFIDKPVEFKAYIIMANYKAEFDRGMPNSNPYQQLMKDKLEINKNLREIKF